MTEGAVRPLSQALHEHVVPWLAIDWPIDWAAGFGRQAPLALEIGFGNGDFLVSLASGRPGWNHVGIELSWGSLQRVLNRLDTGGLTNVRILQGDGAYILRHCFAHRRLDEIHVNFSDPWPKARHHRRRLVQVPFLETAARRLRTGGLLSVATDHPEYAEWIRDALERQEVLAPLDGVPVRHELPGRDPTKYEERGRGAGSRIHYFLWTKPADIPGETPVDEVEPMPNVVFSGPAPGEPLLGRPLPVSIEELHRDVPVHIKLMRVYREEGAEDRLVDALVKEGPLSQHFSILVGARRGGGARVKLGPIGSPRPTWGVKRAVAHVAALLRKSHPELRVESATLEIPSPPGS